MTHYDVQWITLLVYLQCPPPHFSGVCMGWIGNDMNCKNYLQWYIPELMLE